MPVKLSKPPYRPCLSVFVRVPDTAAESPAVDCSDECRVLAELLTGDSF